MLDVERLNTYRGPAHVLHNLSLTVGDRESVCLVGRNGAGKTTTIDSVMGLLPVKSGRIAFAGQDITRLPTHKRALAGIGYSPEDAGIFPDLTVAENFLISQSLARTAGKGAGRCRPTGSTSGCSRCSRRSAPSRGVAASTCREDRRRWWRSGGP